MKMKDFKGVTKTIEVKFISAKNISEDYYEITLEKPKGLTWRPGEHAIFSVPNADVSGKKWRAFSIASTPKEGVILLGTRTGKTTSEFKKVFLNLKEGDTVKMRGPFGWFVEQDLTTPVVMIALGVGITPIRALLVKFEHQHDRVVDVVYSSQQTFMFKDRIEEIINHNDSFNISYPKTIDDTKKEINTLVKSHGNNAYYYISGAPNAIKSVQKQLKDSGVKGKRMINDPFMGY
jgi:NAD(P)H-flavin reductase